MRLRLIIPLLLILTSLSAQEVRVAVHLTNGERFEGYIEVTDDERFVTLALHGTRLKIPRTIVERIVPMRRELKLLILCHPDQSIAEQFREELERGVVEEDVRRLPPVRRNGRQNGLPYRRKTPRAPRLGGIRCRRRGSRRSTLRQRLLLCDKGRERPLGGT